jgi:N-methylhydantoinase A
VEARLGIDIGGTFTDLVLVGSDGSVLTHKVLSTPDDFGNAIISGVRDLLDQVEAAIAEVVHGTTICSNTILEGKGARTGLITTRGFRDALEIGRMRYPRLYDLTWSKPAPLVPRRRRREVIERLDRDGAVVEPLDEASVVAAVRALLADGIESLAVCLLHSYAYDHHERRVREIAEHLAPEVPISLSSEVLPEIGEYERTSTTVINAYLQPIVGGYLENLARSLASVDVNAPVYVMQSNGGVMAASAASKRPIHIVESGPAAGVIAAQQVARDCDLSDVIALDMGGTTAKASIIESGNLQRASEFEVAGGLNIGNRLNTGAGYKLRVAALDVVEVGAGGGSLVTVDAAGALHVGPESAGAVPGPVCYARGGVQPTLSDANLLLGYLNPSILLGGSLPVDYARAEAAFQQRIAQPLGLELLQAAHGVHQIAVANMVRAVRAISSERGRDPRRFACIAYGGNGPLHAVSAAVELGIGLVVVPPSPGVFSAFGLLRAEPAVHAARSLLCSTRTLTVSVLEDAYGALEREVTDSLVAQGHLPTHVERARTMDVHYAGQSFELSLPMNPVLDGAAIEAIDSRFAAEHERTYGHRAENDPVEVVHIRVQGRVPAQPTSRRAAIAQVIPESSRRAFFGAQNGLLETPVIQRGSLDSHARRGPVIVEEYDATTLVPPGWSVHRDEHDNLLIERSRNA